MINTSISRNCSFSFLMYLLVNGWGNKAVFSSVKSSKYNPVVGHLRNPGLNHFIDNEYVQISQVLNIFFFPCRYTLIKVSCLTSGFVTFLLQAVYIAPLKALVRERIEDWKVRIEEKLGKKYVSPYLIREIRSKRAVHQVWIKSTEYFWVFQNRFSLYTILQISSIYKKCYQYSLW